MNGRPEITQPSSLLQRVETKRGDLVWAKDAHGELLPRVAVTDEINGRDFPVVWLVKESEWERSLLYDYPPERGVYSAPGTPWPIEDVTPRA